ncbi:uncharacterized protein CANTADRAFT_53798 [Suhomyces tanzawaensis NRRL Y-17324]|uniref:RRM domain-containing protein n=1 Tax=Suhomyces tanzawaensis NRRL Y-17324 TaxID=984487 RepID=A0A1E4SGP7_9ASCO|nr:uncharacterized protein CANTADRAFT_53798 [Suhomyces tanzawaensis NRRL Y-17324]ODV78689.1 hypothetical protein CANTADRAFT_53798 [Suhomyces tanzawaensis NRRL Y-17324]
MSTIIASHIPTTVSVDKVREFFLFCGKIKAITPLEKSDKFQAYEIVFESEKALSTAELLNDAELDGVPIVVEKASASSAGATTTASSSAASGDLPPQYSATVGSGAGTSDTKTGDSHYDDISQEEKPKYAIMAQLLSQGYVVSDRIVEKSIEVDKEKGISASFKNFLTSLDSKFIHSQEPDSTTNKNLSNVQNTLGSWTSLIAKSPYTAKLAQYYDRAAASPAGVKVHAFYRNISSDVKQIHEEAKRLSELKKSEQAEAKLDPSVASANAAAAINTAN